MLKLVSYRYSPIVFNVAAQVSIAAREDVLTVTVERNTADSDAAASEGRGCRGNTILRMRRFCPTTKSCDHR